MFAFDGDIWALRKDGVAGLRPGFLPCGCVPITGGEAGACGSVGTGICSTFGVIVGSHCELRLICYVDQECRPARREIGWLRGPGNS